MFAKPPETLKAREGTLAETPLPLLLHALLVEERSCTLELKFRVLEKKIVIEDGAPVGCNSNLLHETLGKYLQERGKITEAQYQETLVESVQSGARIGEVLVKKGVISPFDLYKQMQANLARKILDCFRWGEAKYRLVGDAELSDSPVRMNAVQLILTGTSTALPFEVVTTHFAFADEQRFAPVPNPLHPPSEMKLAPKDVKLLNVLRQRPVFSEVLAKTGLEMEEALRRLYAFAVLGLVDFAEAVPQAATAAKPTPEAVPEPAAAPSGVPFADEDEATKNALLATFMEHRGKDPFDLLGIAPDAASGVFRKAFLSASERFSPLRFRGAELKEKAQELLLAYARAFGAVSDAEQLALHRKRRQMGAEAKAKGPPRPSAAEQFRIKTDLLDASSQFSQGKARMDAGNWKAALDYFQYAFEIEPKAAYRAHLAWARYQLNPQAHGRLALSELADAGTLGGGCEEAHFFAGEIHRAQGEYGAAETSYRQAFKMNSGNRKYADLAHEMSRLKKSK